MRVAAPPPASPPVLSGFEKEQEDVALRLFMLSRDTSMWSSPVKEEPFQSATKQAALPRCSYACNSDDDSALLQYGDAKIKGRIPKGRKRSSPKQQCEAVARSGPGTSASGAGRCSARTRRSATTAATSGSTPAAAPPRSRPPPHPQRRRPEPSTETETYRSFSNLSPSASPDSVVIGFRKSKDQAVPEGAENFECAVCFRVFASEQALGEHKQSHLIAVDDNELNASGADQEQHLAATARFLDLNFPPAPPEEA